MVVIVGRLLLHSLQDAVVHTHWQAEGDTAGGCYSCALLPAAAHRRAREAAAAAGTDVNAACDELRRKKTRKKG